MNQHNFIRNFLACTAILALTGCLMTDGQSTDKNPNILFIAIDDMNDWSTVFDKNNPIKTPNLERLAKREMLFRKMDNREWTNLATQSKYVEMIEEHKRWLPTTEIKENLDLKMDN